MPRRDVTPARLPAQPPIAAVPLPDDMLQAGPSPGQLWAMLRAHALWIATCAALLVAVTVFATRNMAKVYKATAGVLISYEAKDPLTGRDVASFLAPSYLTTQLDLLRGHELLLEVVDRLGWADDPARTEGYTGAPGEEPLRAFLAHGLAQRLEIKSHKDSRLVTVTFSDNDPAAAARVANLVAQVYLDRHGQYSRVDPQLVENLRAQLIAIEARKAGLISNLGPRHPTRVALAAEEAAVRQRLDAELNADAPGHDEAANAIARRKEHSNASLASPATIPLEPSWPKPKLNLLAGLVLGILFGAVTALLREFVKRRVHCREDVEREAGLAVLVELPRTRRWLRA